MTVLKGPAWVFGDQINTDLILPVHAVLRPRDMQPQYVFEANRPGWTEQVASGDIIVAGTSFGGGSGRPAARALRDLGISAVVADSVNGLFIRGAIAAGLPCLEAPGITDRVVEGDVLEIDLEGWHIQLQDGTMIKAKPLPTALKQMMLAGGVLPFLESHGYVKASTE